MQKRQSGRMDQIRSPKEEYEEYLRQRRKVLTRDRIRIMDAVFDIHDHFEASELAVKIKVPSTDPRLAKVVNELVEAGLIREVHFGTGPDKYEHVYGHVHHDHLACMSCGKVVEFRNEQIEKLQNQVAEENGFHVVRHNLQIIGLCKDCQKKNVPHAHEYIPTPDERAGAQVPLSLIRNGEHVVLTQVRGGREFRRRLADMGLSMGDEFRVESNSFSGPVIVHVKDTRLAIGHGMTHKILVKILDQEGGNEKPLAS